LKKTTNKSLSLSSLVESTWFPKERYTKLGGYILGSIVVNCLSPILSSSYCLAYCNVVAKSLGFFSLITILNLGRYKPLIKIHVKISIWYLMTSPLNVAKYIIHFYNNCLYFLQLPFWLLVLKHSCKVLVKANGLNLVNNASFSTAYILKGPFVTYHS